MIPRVSSIHIPQTLYKYMKNNFKMTKNNKEKTLLAIIDCSMLIARRNLLFLELAGVSFQGKRKWLLTLWIV
jgi:hypothetical protein